LNSPFFSRKIKVGDFSGLRRGWIKNPITEYGIKVMRQGLKATGMEVFFPDFCHFFTLEGMAQSLTLGIQINLNQWERLLELTSAPPTVV
jgi:hypothetical protein